MLEETVRRNLLAGWVPRPRGGPAAQSEDHDPHERLLLELAPWLRPDEVFNLGLEWFAVVPDVDELRAWLFHGGAGAHDHETVRRLREVGVSPESAGEQVRDQWGRVSGSRCPWSGEGCSPRGTRGEWSRGASAGLVTGGIERDSLGPRSRRGVREHW